MKATTEQISALEAYFKTVNLPAGVIELTPGERIVDVAKFIEGHLEVVKANPGKLFIRPYLDRLLLLKRLLECRDETNALSNEPLFQHNP